VGGIVTGGPQDAGREWMLAGIAMNGAMACALVLGIGSSAVYFLLDVSLPPQMSFGVLYATVVLFGLLARARSVVLGYACSSTLLIALGWVLNPVLDHSIAGMVNRGLSLFVIWAIACMAWHYLHAQQELEEALRALAESDPLTEIMNRAGITAELGRRCGEFQRYGSAFAVLLVDIDRFKSINDSLGHLAGDQVLRRVANIIRSALREIDSVGRYGGEEFIVVLPGTRLDSAINTAERIRLAIEQVPVRVDRALLKVTVSIGVAAAAPGEHCGAEALIEAADRQMYGAKRGGRNRVMPAPRPGVPLRASPVRAVT
jgi:diguanylate cyclase (GGDEF)-like protein